MIFFLQLSYNAYDYWQSLSQSLRGVGDTEREGD